MTVTIEPNEEEVQFVAHGEEQTARCQAGATAPGGHQKPPDAREKGPISEAAQGELQLAIDSEVPPIPDLQVEEQPRERDRVENQTARCRLCVQQGVPRTRRRGHAPN